MVFKCESIEPDDDYFLVSLREGKKREIRRMLQAIGHHVEDLQRIEFGGVKLGDLPEGRFRELTADELNRLAKL